MASKEVIPARKIHLWQACLWTSGLIHHEGFNWDACTLTLVKAEEDCSRCASAMTTLFNAIKTSEGYNGLSKVMHKAICEVDSTVYSCQDQERAQKLDEALEAIALSDQEAKIACKTMESKGACSRQG